MNFNYTKLDPNVPNLIRGTEHSAGIDLYAANLVLPNGDLRTEKFLTYMYIDSAATIGTGVAVEIPQGYFGLVAVRSGLGFNSDAWTHMGVIDSDYRGEIKIRLHTSTQTCTINKYDRIAQLLIVPCFLGVPTEVSELSETERGQGGFGSTGT